MLHFVPLVALVTMATTSLPPVDPETPRVASAGVSLFDFMPKVRLPFLSRRGTDRPEPLELVDRRLRDLVVQQEAWFAKEGRYGRNAYRAGLLRSGDSTAFAEVHVEILYAGKVGWTALASHPAAPWKSCVVYVGFRERLPIMPRTHESAREATLEGIPACDDRK